MRTLIISSYALCLIMYYEKSFLQMLLLTGPPKCLSQFPPANLSTTVWTTVRSTVNNDSLHLYSSCGTVSTRSSTNTGFKVWKHHYCGHMYNPDGESVGVCCLYWECQANNDNPVMFSILQWHTLRTITVNKKTRTQQLHGCSLLVINKTMWMFLSALCHKVNKISTHSL